MNSPSHVIDKGTCRIVCNDGASIGTGFWFAFVNPEDQTQTFPMLVTNKHVMEGAKKATILLSVTCQHNPSKKFHTIEIPNPSEHLIMHPEKNVDLCALPFGPTLSNLDKEGIHLDAFMFTDHYVQKDAFLTPIEEVHMTGYPNGLWDEVNNKPITRKGITASNPKMDWNGKKEFMIDMACFGGSSGSPVYILNEGTFSTPNGLAMGSRLILLGILYAGPQVSVDGTINIVEVPTAAVAVSNTRMMMNLGFVIKAEKLLDFKKLLGL